MQEHTERGAVEPAAKRAIRLEDPTQKQTPQASAESPEPDLGMLGAIRARPGMYVGWRDQRGLRVYLASPVALLLENHPTSLHLTVGVDDFELVSDAVFALERTEQGIVPFSAPKSRMGIWMPDAGILAALSQELEVSITTVQRREELHFVRGVLTQDRSVPLKNEEPIGTRLRFRPDGSIFEVTHIDPDRLMFYFHGLAYLYPGLRFSLTVQGETQTFRYANGVTDFFADSSASLRLMHTPIQCLCEGDGLRLQLILAFHTGQEDRIYSLYDYPGDPSLANHQHDAGLRLTIKNLRKRLKLPNAWGQGGVVAAMCSSANKPGVWSEDISFASLAGQGIRTWLGRHPEVLAQLKRLQTEPFREE